MTRKERREKKLEETRKFFKKDKQKNILDVEINLLKFKKIIFFLLLLQFILFPFLSPYEPMNSSSYQLTNPFNWFIFIFSQINGYIHEAGHGVCYILPCPEVITVAMGTIFQIGFFILFWKYFKNKNNLLSSIYLYFAGLSIQYTSWYISTSHTGAMVSASNSFTGIAGKHDFYYLLDIIGLVPYDGIVSSIVRISAYFIMLLAIYKIYKVAFK